MEKMGGPPRVLSKLISAHRRSARPLVVCERKTAGTALMLGLLGEVPAFHHNTAICLLSPDGILDDLLNSYEHLLGPRILGVQFLVALGSLHGLHLGDDLLELRDQLAFMRHVAVFGGIALFFPVASPGEIHVIVQ